jgi:DNA-binding NarL/FixJ family response regulator
MARGRILIAEDEVITSLDLWHLLDMWGFDMCRQVSTGEGAVEVAAQERPDVVLMDISLRGSRNGIEAATEIQSRLGIPVIFISGYDDAETMQRAEAASPAGYFVKPLDFYKLRSTIESVIRNKTEPA